MIFPYRTDAPIYHWPAATLGLIAVNVAAFAAASSDAAWAEDLILFHGERFSPLQWLTSSFLHGSLEHLASNVLFLWVFGLIVEGKLGWLRFLPLCLGIGAAECAIESGVAAALGLEGASFGASAIIYGLMAIAAVWAPMNEVDVFYWACLRMGTFSVTVRTLAAGYIAIQALLAVLGAAAERPFTSALLHLLGAAIGFPAGVVLLRKGVVDCEGWDIFSLRGGKPRPERRRRPPEPGGAAAGAEGDERETALLLMRSALGARRPRPRGCHLRGGGPPRRRLAPAGRAARRDGRGVPLFRNARSG